MTDAQKVAYIVSWIIAIACVVIFAYVARAGAHDWYPSNCCSGCDCRPIADDAVRVTAGGWLVVATGEVIPFGKARQSRDGRFHRCSPSYCRADGEDRTICFFAPGMGA